MPWPRESTTVLRTRARQGVGFVCIPVTADEDGVYRRKDVSRARSEHPAGMWWLFRIRFSETSVFVWTPLLKAVAIDWRMRVFLCTTRWIACHLLMIHTYLSVTNFTGCDYRCTTWRTCFVRWPLSSVTPWPKPKLVSFGFVVHIFHSFRCGTFI